MSTAGVVGWVVIVAVTLALWIGGAKEFTDATGWGMVAGVAVYAVLWQVRYSRRRLRR